MRLLLDTHIWLWGARDPARLHPRVAAALIDDTNELYLSPISSWEITMLVGKGRLDLGMSAEVWIAKALREGLFNEAPFSHAAALELRNVGIPQPDPADRMIVATAIASAFTLVTNDWQIVEAGTCEVLSNR